ncbi:UDP-N-acetyl-D-mannosamine dehydrogenase [Acanthopleuribacter pedis]|uniref:UDP-N-acetyl-D-mannosamine dehydrogenase n=1 Tax=Acanthopleuribacter pedis TaxID=442870 RepID=A0A8J7Q9I6_9BACT|nr:UDP-N-acetyl-D-mannosamine dehydrogenase [Acanthopleuribacter pedis]MBO1320400.1 UDP-N-acetyl-D-mannosamine dehydrogenase [Acanthopleuribacter pedis]
MKPRHKVIVSGLGYIGLPTASLIATKGFEVRGVDVSEHIVDTINQGKIHIYEPDLDVLVRSAVNSGNLTASLEPSAGDIFIIAVPTPIKNDHTSDIHYIEQAVTKIAPYLAPGNLIILESTSPVTTTEKIGDWLRALRPDLSIPSFTLADDDDNEERIFLAHCPERVLPGRILKELVDNTRVVGGVDPASTRVAMDFYRSFVNGEILPTNSRTAEMTKLTENAFRDVNIAFANELSLIADQLEIDVWELIGLANHHPRVNVLQPGPGVGGHCIAVDPWFIVEAAPDKAKLIRQAREVNLYKTDYVLGRIHALAGTMYQPKVACLGLSFKADIDDFRESPALDIVTRLDERLFSKVLVVEPHCQRLPAGLLNREGFELVDLDEALAAAQMVVVLVNHKAFYAVAPEALQGKTVLDTRGVWRFLEPGQIAKS